jgi:hypothetical protein
MALDGMQPTLRHVPPSEPRFSMHAVYESILKQHKSFMSLEEDEKKKD